MPTGLQAKWLVRGMLCAFAIGVGALVFFVSTQPYNGASCSEVEAGLKASHIPILSGDAWSRGISIELFNATKFVSLASASGGSVIDSPNTPFGGDHRTFSFLDGGALYYFSCGGPTG